MTAGARRFACTQCGACCNRSPEVELSEAAALADVFVFSLMFRLYTVPSALKDDPEFRAGTANASERFYQEKRLLNAFAARKSSIRLRRDGKPVEHSQYLVMSALALDTGTGACAALENNLCQAYERRPLSCRAVPLHYSRGEASLGNYLDAFTATPGYGCDTGETAPLVFDAGRIADQGTQQVRAEALALAERERPWKEAILRRLKAGDPDLPSLRQIEDNAAYGAMTTSMRIAWEIALMAGLMESAECRALIERQLAVIERELGRASSAARETLNAMQAEYSSRLAVV